SLIHCLKNKQRTERDKQIPLSRTIIHFHGLNSVFRCSLCSRWWNSAEIHVLFLMKLDRTMRRGTVNMQIFRQECKKCTAAVMEKPEISQENIRIIIGNLVNRIQRKFYSPNSWDLDEKPVLYSERREGPHNKEHCEACKQNVCRWQVLEMKTERQQAAEFSSAGRNPNETRFRGEMDHSRIFTSLAYMAPIPLPLHVRANAVYCQVYGS
uniref:SH3 domain-binding protein 5-like n=1 Tax=Xenopus tropicalis TaxID=8364 RepID=A0A803KIS1_XENTR